MPAELRNHALGMPWLNYMPLVPSSLFGAPLLEILKGLSLLSVTPRVVATSLGFGRGIGIRVREVIRGLACHTAARQMASTLGCAMQVHRAEAQFKMAMNHVSLNLRIAFCMFTLLKPDDHRTRHTHSRADCIAVKISLLAFGRFEGRTHVLHLA
jgi:hypothetical protein